MIWGITLEPGQAYTEVIEDEVHLSMATMESRGCIGSKADNFSHVVIKTGTAEYLLCTLVNGITYQQCLDLKLMPSDKVTFSVQGTNVVYLTGYSFVTSEADQEITETEDWIEDPMLEDVPQDNIEYSGDDSRFLPSDETVQRQHPNTGEEEEDNSTDLSDREQYSVQYEVPAAEQQYQHLPERGHHQTTLGVPSRSSHGQPQQHPPRDTDGSSFIIKEEIHTIVDTEEDTPPDQTNEEIHNQSRNQTIHQPSTSTGQIGSLGYQSTTQPLPQSSNTPVDIWKSNDGVWSNSHNESRIIGSHDRNITMESSQYDHNMRMTQGRNIQALLVGTTHDSQRCREQISQGQSGSNMADSNIRDLRTAFVGDRTSQPTVTEGRNGEKSHHCRFCLRGFKFPSSVRAHERVHTGERPYMCRFCFKRFKKSDHKNTHERTHTGERPYGCNLCPKRFKQLGHLREHVMTHRKGKK